MAEGVSARARGVSSDGVEGAACPLSGSPEVPAGKWQHAVISREGAPMTLVVVALVVGLVASDLLNLVERLKD